MKKIRMTAKKKEILALIVKRNADGSLMDTTQIMESVSYTASRGAILGTIKFLIRDGLVEKRKIKKRRGGNVRTYSATSLGYTVN